MPARRILSVWFPRLGAERLLRRRGDAGARPFAVVADDGQRQVLSSLSPEAEAAGLTQGQPLREAMALCPELATQTQHRAAEAAFLRALARWADRFSPLVGVDGTDGLRLDITGCAHLFSGEAALIDSLTDEARALGLTTRCGLADTLGAAWALARFAGQGTAPGRSGDAIQQEARATRSRAAKRPHWARARPQSTGTAQIAPPGQMHAALAPLPIAALRLPEATLHDLGRLGLRRIGDLIGQPRAGLGRRFGPHLMQRLDQALGLVPEPLSPTAPPPHFATRLSLPDPIGLTEDIRAGLARLTDRLCVRLREQGQGARHLRFEAFRSDGSLQVLELRLARPSHAPETILPLMEGQLDRLDAGFGIDVMRLEARVTEPTAPRQLRSPEHDPEAGHSAQAALDDLITRLGGRIGLDAITRRHPAESRIPEKTATTLAAAWSEPAPGPWPAPEHPRPLLIWRPEPLRVLEPARPCAAFHWRGREHRVTAAIGPERIAPEWWFDDPDWRSGLRDYWQIVTTRGERLWLFQAHGGQVSGGWFCQGRFA
ncbi:protein ImuB [Roseovarius tolerans]|uniref:DNA-directed DNA polymerase n=1 Tax=Roseovarius tolerans TaxID=74031 RepID=A0A1H8GGE3_9RHOB|nr:DNA polymerase Y family protein [Roseovarius tolerans]SEN43043.1 protein ImuB [Roseovarius tolerans]